MPQSQPPAGKPTPTISEKVRDLQEWRHITVLELREALSEVTNASTAHIWVIALGTFTVRLPFVCFAVASNRP
jgi:hypothetical protein